MKETIMSFIFLFIFSSANAHPIILHQKINYINYIDLFLILLMFVTCTILFTNSGKIKNDEKKY